MHTVKTIGQPHVFLGSGHCEFCNSPVEAGVTPGNTVVSHNHDTKQDEYRFGCTDCTNQGKDYLEQVLNHHQQ